ncbi:MAG: hypothetical protein OXP09_08380 [Gammaproteobacteria bacterium]|nr:hypothetical protein [Gammaproteobacteria bacterium]
MDYDPEQLLQDVAFELSVDLEEEGTPIIELAELFKTLEIATHVASGESYVLFDTHDLEVQQAGLNLSNNISRSWPGLDIGFTGREERVFAELQYGSSKFGYKSILNVHNISSASPLTINGRTILLLFVLAVVYGDGQFSLDVKDNELKVRASFSSGLGEAYKSIRRTFGDPNRLTRLTVTTANQVVQEIKETQDSPSENNE